MLLKATAIADYHKMIKKVMGEKPCMNLWHRSAHVIHDFPDHTKSAHTRMQHIELVISSN